MSEGVNFPVTSSFDPAGTDAAQAALIKTSEVAEGIGAAAAAGAEKAATALAATTQKAQELGAAIRAANETTASAPAGSAAGDALSSQAAAANEATAAMQETAAAQEKLATGGAAAAAGSEKVIAGLQAEVAAANEAVTAATRLAAARKEMSAAGVSTAALRASSLIQSGVTTSSELTTGMGTLGFDPTQTKAAVAELEAIVGPLGGELKQFAEDAQLVINLEQRTAEVTELVEQGYLKEAAALVKLNEAQVKYQALLGSGQGSTIAGQKALVATAQAQAGFTAAAAGGSGGGGGGIKAFTSGFLGGFGGGESGDTARLGDQTAQVAKYLALYQVFRLVETGLRDAITQTVDFERAISDLSNRLDLPRDKATSLANSLANIGAPAGLNPSESVALGTQFAGTFQGQGNPADLAKQGAQLGAEVSVLGGGAKDAAATMEDLTAATRAFNLQGSETPRVLDAATSAAKNFGLANASVVLPGLAQIGDLASAAGFSVEQTANTLADLQARTGETSAATAGELQRFFGRSGNAAFQQVFSGLGVNTLQPFNDELSDLSAKFDTLTQKQRDLVTSQFGGGRAGVAALALIEDYGKVQDATNKTVQDGGIAQQQYFARLNDIHGILDTLKGDFEELAKNVGTSGVGAGIGVLLEALKPVLSTANDLLNVFNMIPAPLRDAAALAAEIAVAARIIGAVNIGERVSALGANVRSRVGGAVDAATTRGPAILASGGGAVGEAVGGTAIAGAEVAGAAKVKAATDAEAAALTAGAEETSLANTKVSTALSDLTGVLLTGASRLKLALDEEVASLRVAAAEQETTTGLFALGAAGGALAKGVSGLLDAIGPLGLAIGGFIAIDAVFNATNKILTAKSATTGSGSIDALTGAASDAGRQAVTDREASSGFVGSILNALAGNPTGNDAAASRRSQQTDLALKDQQQKAIDSERQPDQAAALVQLQDAADGTSGLASSLKALTDAGYTAQQQMDAVVKKLNDAAAAANGFIPKDQIPALAAASGSVVAKSISEQAQNEKDKADQANASGFRGLVPGFLTPDRVKAQVSTEGKTLGSLDQAKFASTASDAISGFLDNQDPTGAPLDPKQLGAEKQKVYEALVAEAKAEGKKGKELASILPDLLTAAGTAVDSQLQTLIGAGQLTSSDITGIVNGLQATAQQAGQDAATNASLAGGGGQGADLTGAQTTLSNLQGERAALEKQKNATPQDFQQLDQDIAAAKLAVQTATVANIKSLGDVQAANISPFDKDGQIKASLATLGQELGATTDPAQERQLEIAIQQGVNQQNAQKVADANSLRDSQVSSADKTGADTAKVGDAAANLKAITDTGVTSGQAYTDALKAFQDALYTQANDTVDQANAIRDASIDPRDSTGAAAAKVTDAVSKLNELTAQGADPTQLANQRLAVAQAELASQQADVAKQNAATAAGVRQGDPVSAAQAALVEAQNSLAHDLLDSQQYYTDLAAVHQAEYTLAQSIVARAKITAELGSDTTDPVAQAFIAAQSALQQYQQDKANGTGDLGADQLAVTQGNDAAQKAAFTQQLSNEQTKYSLQQESGAAYADYLDKESASLKAQLATMHKGQDGYQQLLDEMNQVTQARLALSQQYNGQFNLGNIRVPTIYDVRSSIASASGGAGGAGAPSTTYQTVNFQINGADTAKVQQIINQQLGGGALSARGLTTPKVSVSR